MVQIPIFYATTEGQTARIAERLATLFRECGYSSAVIEVGSERAQDFDWTPVRAVLVGASLHAGRHQASVSKFVREHLLELSAHTSAFFSVSLSAASSHPEEVAEAKRIAARFCEDTHWTPTFVMSLAGRLAYTKYGWLKRRVMRRIAEKEGGPTDIRQDHELTDWKAVGRLAAQVAGYVDTRLAS